MKIDLTTIDLESFCVDEHLLNGEPVYLIQPQFVNVKWKKDTLIFRSSLWNTEGELVSAGHKKFFNWGEQPEISPVLTSLENCNILEKIDGSLLIVSKYNGNFILRTRGTVDATKLNNGYELDIFKKQYLPKLVDFFETTCNHKSKDTWPLSFLFEWVSPNQRIILNYGDQPEWYLVGCIGHVDYSIAPQVMLDELAGKAGFKRPPIYSFSTVEDLIKKVEQWKGKEGVVVYSNSDQTLHKIKSVSYLFLHRMKEAFGSIDKVVDVWFSRNCPTYQEFEQYIVTTFDWELWKMIQGDVSKICDAWKSVQRIVEGMTKFVDETLRPLPTRRQQAEKVIASYGKTNRSQFVFSLLDSEPLNGDQKKKLLYQCLKS